MDDLFLLLVTLCVIGVIVLGGFFISVAIVAITEGKESAKEFFWTEWRGYHRDSQGEDHEHDY